MSDALPYRFTEVPISGILVSNQPTDVFTIRHLSASVAVILYDPLQTIGAIGHILLPNSTLADFGEQLLPGKFADLAIPELVSQYLQSGGQQQNTLIRMAGGTQLFHFGGGDHALNVGARNAIAIRTALSREGFGIEKEDVGGNKGRELNFYIDQGRLQIQQPGGDPYSL